MTMTASPPAVACFSPSLSWPSRSSPLQGARLHGTPSRALAASKAWVAVVASTWSTRRSYHSQANDPRSEEHTSELQSRQYLVCRLLLEKKKRRWGLEI